MNLTEFKNEVAKQLGLPEDVSTDKLIEAVIAALLEKEENGTKLERYKEEYNIVEAKEEDFAKAALKGFEVTGTSTLFVSSTLTCFLEQSYCRENSKGFYYIAEKVGDEAKLTRVER